MLYTLAPVWVRIGENEGKPMTDDKTTLPPQKKRYEWIDNARIVAALLIIYVHIPTSFQNEPLATSTTAVNLITGSTIFGRVPFFLILAGYFLGRKITWHKAIDRAIWLFIPFFLWNLIFWVLYSYETLLSPSWRLIDYVHAIPHILGTSCLFSPRFHILSSPMAWPTIDPTWFLRDIVLLSLLTPILVRFKGLIMASLLVVASFEDFNLPFQSGVTLAPYTLFYYLLGVCLCNFRIDDAYCIFNKRFTPIFVISLAIITTVCIVLGCNGVKMINATIIGPLFGAMLIAYCGVLVEKHLPKLSKRLAPCGPACFLVFVLHRPLLHALSLCLPGWITGTILIWLLPIPVCAAIIALFLLMKRYAPLLLPYLGHMKVPKKQPVDAPAAKAS